MALDKYLLESSSVDGYAPEDGSGAYILEDQPSLQTANFITDLEQNTRTKKISAIAVAMAYVLIQAPIPPPAFITGTGFDNAAEEPTVINSYSIYDQTTGPVGGPAAQTFKAITNDQNSTKTRLKAALNESVFIAPPIAQAFTVLTNDLNQSRVKAKTISDDLFIAPQISYITSTVASFIDENVTINSYQLYDQSAGPVAQLIPPPQNFIQIAEAPRFKAIIRSSESLAFTSQFPAQPFGIYQPSDQSPPRIIQKRISEPFSFPQQNQTTATTITSTVANFIDETVIIGGFQVYSPSTGPVGTVPFQPVGSYQPADQSPRIIQKRLSEPFSFPQQNQTAATLTSTVASFIDENTIIQSRLVYDISTGPVRSQVAATTPANYGYQLSDQLFRDNRQRRTPTSAYVFGIPIDDLGFINYDQQLPQRFKKQNEAFSYPVHPIAAPPALTSTVTCFVDENTIIQGQLVYDISAGPVGNQNVVAVVATSGYQVFDQQRAKRTQIIHDPVAAPVQQPPAATPSSYGYQLSDQKLPQHFVKQSEAFVYPYQVFVFAATPSIYGYQLSDQKLPQHFIHQSEAFHYPHHVIPPPPPATDQYLIGGPDITELFVTHGHISSGGISYTLNPLSRRTV